MKKDYMNFGNLRKAYDSGRFGYPEEVMDYVFSLINKKYKVLDLGCGTGIATRQLKSNIDDVIGCDIDEKMIEMAQFFKDNINYYVAPSNQTPFESEIFEVITSFGAFHWFCDNESVNEIKRILKKNGFFIIINKNEIGDFKKDFRNMIEEVTKEKLPERIKVGYNPEQILVENNFTNITKKKFLFTEKFTISRALNQLQSMGFWNYVSEDKKDLVLKEMEKYFKKTAKNGIVSRQLEIVVVSGRKI